MKLTRHRMRIMRALDALQPATAGDVSTVTGDLLSQVYRTLRRFEDEGYAEAEPTQPDGKGRPPLLWSLKVDPEMARNAEPRSRTVTVRLSPYQLESLREEAAECGLSVSAYARELIMLGWDV